MHSFTSSFRHHPASRWWVVFGVGCLVSGGLVWAAEHYWRSLGHQPTVIDSTNLWSSQRSQVYGDNALVFIGASRTLFGIDLNEVRRRVPRSKPVMLALNGRYPVATLMDLANDEAFNGTLIVDVDARGLSKFNWGAQKPYVDYYNHDWSPNWRFHRWLLNTIQKNVVIADPRFSLLSVIVRKWQNQPQPGVSHTSLDQDRMGYLDFGKANGKILGNWFADMLEEDLSEHPAPEPDKWLLDLEAVAEAAKRIESRGGAVLFYVPPVRGRQKSLVEAAYPKSLYWDRFIATYDLKGVHFADAHWLRKIPLPDESHVDQHDKVVLTSALINALNYRGLL